MTNELLLAFNVVNNALKTRLIKLGLGICQLILILPRLAHREEPWETAMDSSSIRTERPLKCSISSS